MLIGIVLMAGQEFCDLCEPAREVTNMAKKTFKMLAWEEWVQYLRENQDDVMAGASIPPLPVSPPAPAVPQTREDVVRAANPGYSPVQIQAAIVVEDEVVPLFRDGQLTEMIFVGDAGWFGAKAALL